MPLDEPQQILYTFFLSNFKTLVSTCPSSATGRERNARTHNKRMIKTNKDDEIAKHGVRSIFSCFKVWKKSPTKPGDESWKTDENRWVHGYEYEINSLGELQVISYCFLRGEHCVASNKKTHSA